MAASGFLPQRCWFEVKFAEVGRIRRKRNRLCLVAPLRRFLVSFPVILSPLPVTWWPEIELRNVERGHRGQRGKVRLVDCRHIFTPLDLHKQATTNRWRMTTSHKLRLTLFMLFFFKKNFLKQKLTDDLIIWHIELSAASCPLKQNQNQNKDKIWCFWEQRSDESFVSRTQPCANTRAGL